MEKYRNQMKNSSNQVNNLNQMPYSSQTNNPMYIQNNNKIYNQHPKYKAIQNCFPNGLNNPSQIGVIYQNQNNFSLMDNSSPLPGTTIPLPDDQFNDNQFQQYVQPNIQQINPVQPHLQPNIQQINQVQLYMQPNENPFYVQPNNQLRNRHGNRFEKKLAAIY